MRSHVAAFVLALVVGALGCLLYIGAGAVLELPHTVLADSNGANTVPRIIVTALVFATLCTITRALVVRRR